MMHPKQLSSKRLREDIGDIQLNPQRFTFHLTTFHLVDDDERGQFVAQWKLDRPSGTGR
jgi:hypothetical protein